MKSAELCRVVIIASNPQVREEYATYLTPLNIQLENVASISELYALLPKLPINGLLLDVATLVRASAAEKAFIHDLIQVFPSARVRWDAQAKTARVLLYGQTVESSVTLESFIVEQCVPFKARTIRFSDRVEAFFNVLLSLTPVSTEHTPLRSVTMNVSRGGCFIFTLDPPEPHRLVSVRFMEFGALQLTAEVRWRKMWGGTMGVPGIGVRFTDITDDVATELLKLAGEQTLKFK